MDTYQISDMIKGWFVGPFNPTCFQTDEFECAVKEYKKGDKEASHFHKIATEFTVIGSGLVKMNGAEYGKGTIIKIMPGEATDFEALEDTITFVVKTPAALGDKYEKKTRKVC